MFPAFLTTLLFSVSGVTAMRSTRYLPSMEANFWRLLLATAMLAAYGHTVGAGFGGAALGWFVVSGIIGFGIGDIALYQAYPRLGSRLVILIVHCVAAPLAAAVEWLWLGVPMTGREALASLLILSGVAGALYPDRAAAGASAGAGAGAGVGAVGSAVRLAGVGFALVAAIGQGVGAVLSRRAFEVARRAGEHIDGISAAYQRIVAGLVLSFLMLLWVNRRRWFSGGGVAVAAGAGAGAGAAAAGQGPLAAGGGTRSFRLAAPWLVINSIAGPALGVSCFQWALAERGTGVVLPIVALTPLTIIPLSMWMEGERPSRRSLAAGAVAVAGAVLHALSH